METSQRREKTFTYVMTQFVFGYLRCKVSENDLKKMRLFSSLVTKGIASTIPSNRVLGIRDPRTKVRFNFISILSFL